MLIPPSFRRLKIAGILVLSVVLLGTIGYMRIEQLSFVDAIYTTISMVSTVGNVIHPITPLGRIFTIFVIIFGVGSLLYTFGAGMEFILEGHFSQAIRRYRMDNKIAALRDHAIICGFGRVGTQIAEDFAAAEKPFVVIDEKEQNIQTCWQCHYLALQGDATSDVVLREAGVQLARCVLVATDNDATNISITLSARHLNSRLFIVARSNHDETEVKLRLAGADRVLSPYMLSGRRMANLAFQPTVIDFFDLIASAASMELSVQEVSLARTSPLIGKTIGEAQNTINDGTVLVALKKPGGSLSGPCRETLIEADSILVMVGVPEQLAAFKEANGQSQATGSS